MEGFNFNIEVPIARAQIIGSLVDLDHDVCIAALMEVDLLQADVGFTEKLIVQLVKSMKKEVDAGLPLNEIDELNFIDWSKV